MLPSCHILLCAYTIFPAVAMCRVANHGLPLQTWSNQGPMTVCLGWYTITRGICHLHVELFDTCTCKSWQSWYQTLMVQSFAWNCKIWYSAKAILGICAWELWPLIMWVLVWGACCRGTVRVSRGGTDVLNWVDVLRCSNTGTACSLDATWQGVQHSSVTPATGTLPCSPPQMHTCHKCFMHLCLDLRNLTQSTYCLRGSI